MPIISTGKTVRIEDQAEVIVHSGEVVVSHTDGRGHSESNAFTEGDRHTIPKRGGATIKALEQANVSFEYVGSEPKPEEHENPVTDRPLRDEQTPGPVERTPKDDRESVPPQKPKASNAKIEKKVVKKGKKEKIAPEPTDDLEKPANKDKAPEPESKKKGSKKKGKK